MENNSSKLDVLDDCVDEELEQLNCDIATMDNVGSSDGEKVRYSWADLPEQVPGSGHAQLGDYLENGGSGLVGQLFGFLE